MNKTIIIKSLLTTTLDFTQKKSIATLKIQNVILYRVPNETLKL